ncbi:MAG: LON peptidase substrate-binding domain-containing protein, partial [Myxococcota bacterium]|nr:LON peptidase substrate-binding domain-containing protein [Myxococcota bacterium]
MAKDPSDKDPKLDDDTLDEDDVETDEKGPRIAGLMSASDDPGDSEDAPGTDVALFDELDECEEDLMESIDQVLPALPLRNSVLYPGALMPLAVGRPKTLRLLNAIGTGGIIAIVSQKDKDVDE